MDTEMIITQDVEKSLRLGLDVYDNQSQRVGRVEFTDMEAGYMMVGEGGIRANDLYVPLRLITNIDPNELYVSVSKEELERDYADPPARYTQVREDGGTKFAVTTEASGYDGAPIIVERAKIDLNKSQIAVGQRVFTLDMVDVGAVKMYDAVTGWMMVERGPIWDTADLMIPVTLVAEVNADLKEVFLVSSAADLERMQHVAPVDVVFAIGNVVESD